MTIRIRRAQPDDLPALALLWHEKTMLQADQHVRFAPNAQMAWITAQAARLNDARHALFVALDENTPVGYAAGWLREQPGMTPARIGVIDDFALDAHAYHSGAGRALHNALRAWFAEYDIAQCAVWLPRSDAVGQAFWRSLGAHNWIDLLWLK